MNDYRKESLQKADVPNILYKYRRWTNTLEKRILTDKEIYFSSPKLFEDHEDCRNFIRYDLLNDEQLYELYLHRSKQKNTSYSNEEHHQFAELWAKKSPLKDKSYCDKIIAESQENYFNCTGIFSMSADPLNEYLWNEYSDNFKGFCVGFESYILSNYFGSCGPVIYEPELPIIYPEPFDQIEHIHLKRVFHKREKWIFEKEYRVCKMLPREYLKNERKVVLPLEAFKSVIIGYKSDEATRNEIIELLLIDFPDIKAYIAEKKNGKIELSQA